MISFVKSAFLTVAYLACEAEAMQKATWFAQKDGASSESTYGYEIEYDVDDMLPKYYANVCVEMEQENPSACSPKDYHIKYEENIFEKGEWLGAGMNGNVYAGINKSNGQKVAIKVMKGKDELEAEGFELKPLNEEIKIYETLKGGPSILQLLAIVMDDETEDPSLVFEFVDF